MKGNVMLKAIKNTENNNIRKVVTIRKENKKIGHVLFFLQKRP